MALMTRNTAFMNIDTMDDELPGTVHDESVENGRDVTHDNPDPSQISDYADWLRHPVTTVALYAAQEQNLVLDLQQLEGVRYIHYSEWNPASDVMVAMSILLWI